MDGSLDVQERIEWVTELTKRTGGENSDYDALEAIEAKPQWQVRPDMLDSYGGSIYEEVGEARRIYDVPKSLENEAKSLTPPPPLPSRSRGQSEVSEEDNNIDFPPPPAFGDDHKYVFSWKKNQNNSERNVDSWILMDPTRNSQNY